MKQRENTAYLVHYRSVNPWGHPKGRYVPCHYSDREANRRNESYQLPIQLIKYCSALGNKILQGIRAEEDGCLIPLQTTREGHISWKTLRSNEKEFLFLLITDASQWQLQQPLNAQFHWPCALWRGWLDLPQEIVQSSHVCAQQMGFQLSLHLIPQNQIFHINQFLFFSLSFFFLLKTDMKVLDLAGGVLKGKGLPIRLLP